MIQSRNLSYTLYYRLYMFIQTLYFTLNTVYKCNGRPAVDNCSLSRQVAVGYTNQLRKLKIICRNISCSINALPTVPPEGARTQDPLPLLNEVLVAHNRRGWPMTNNFKTPFFLYGKYSSQKIKTIQFMFFVIILFMLLIFMYLKIKQKIICT